MRNIIYILILLLTISCSRFNNTKIYKVAIATDFYPFAYYDAEGNLTGIEIDYLKQIEINHNAIIELTPFKSSNLLESFYNGDFDFAIGGITITDERKEIFDFSEPYYYATQTVLTLYSSNITVESLPDIANYRIGVLSNSSSFLFIENEFLKNRLLVAHNLNRYNDLESLIDALKNRQVNLILLEKTPAIKAGDEHGLKIIFENFDVEEYAIVYKKQ